ncbi:hypothetical protein JN09_001352 [Acholeplasma morum]|uniref:hypothetical protein n=1 Tax=Paracholeplasma morum TaxID=264637 RepID=UPI00195C0170|nr:hypothetical protein [Paracholeplasma morum]MBM7454009.1 hypothetical protein [Paracholeplasma morum]
MIKIIENNGIVLLYLAVLSILIYTIYLVFYNWYIEKRLNKKIKKLRVFEPIKWIHFASIPLTILYLISQTVMMVYTTESNKDALNLLKSYTPVIEDVYVQKNVEHAYVSTYRDIIIEIEVSMDQYSTYNNQISFPSVVLLINDSSYEIKDVTFENKMNITDNTALNLKVPFPETLKSEGVYEIHLLSLEVYYIEHKVYKSFSVESSPFSIELIDEETYQLDFILGDIVLGTVELEVGMSLAMFWSENPNHQTHLEQRVNYYVTYVNDLIQGLHILFENKWEFNGDVQISDIIFDDYEVYPIVNNLEDISEDISLELISTNGIDNPYRNNDLKVSLGEETLLSWAPIRDHAFTYKTVIKSDSNEYIDIKGYNAITGLKPGSTEIVVEINLGFLKIEKTIEIEVIPYKAFYNIRGEVVYLKYDLDTNKIIEPLDAPSSHVIDAFNIDSEQHGYYNAMDIMPHISDFLIIDTVGIYDIVLVIYDTTFSKDVIRINHDTYNPLTNTLTITKGQTDRILFDINFDLLTEVEEQYFSRVDTYHRGGSLSKYEAGNTYSITLYIVLDGYYTIGKVINLEVI